MTSVDDLHSRYAVDIQRLESFNDQFHIQNSMDTRMVSDHAKVLDYVTKPDAFVMLFGTNQRRRWAYFNPPTNFSQTRLFFFDNFDSLEQDEADTQRVSSIDCSNADAREATVRQKEKQIIQNFCDMKKGLREDYNYIMGRIHEFVRG